MNGRTIATNLCLIKSVSFRQPPGIWQIDVGTECRLASDQGECLQMVKESAIQFQLSSSSLTSSQCSDWTCIWTMARWSLIRWNIVAAWPYSPMRAMKWPISLSKLASDRSNFLAAFATLAIFSNYFSPFSLPILPTCPPNHWPSSAELPCHNPRKPSTILAQKTTE